MVAKSGLIAVCGMPNVGKSTLVNALVGEKVSIVGPKPQTTRHCITAIRTTGTCQMVFLDTPGHLTYPRELLQQRMNRSKGEAMKGADLVLLVVAPSPPREEHEGELLKLIERSSAPRLLVLNKIDTVRDKRTLLPVAASYNERLRFEQTFMVCAATGDGLEDLLAAAESLLPEQPFLYSPDQISAATERFFAQEVIREKLFLLLKKEVPYGVHVEVEAYEEKEKKLYIRATIYVERESHKAIVIGAGGGMLKQVGRLAREELEVHLGRPIFLDLWVKVKAGWKEQGSALKTFGY